MRTLPFILGIIAITFLSCSKKKEEETNTKEKINTEEVKNQVTLGKNYLTTEHVPRATL